MRRFVEGIDRGQATLFPECLEDWIDGDNPVRAIDAFVDKLDLPGLGFDGVAPETTGRPSYHPSGLLKLYIYGYLNRVQSSRRLEREAGRNVEVMWLTCRLVPDHKTIADFRKDNGPALKQVCVQFVELCRTSSSGRARHSAVGPCARSGASGVVGARRLGAWLVCDRSRGHAALLRRDHCVGFRTGTGSLLGQGLSRLS
jgi:transposase